MTEDESVAFFRRMAALAGLTVADFAHRMNTASPEQVAQCMERLDTETLEWAVGFEALGEGGKA